MTEQQRLGQFVVSQRSARRGLAAAVRRTADRAAHSGGRDIDWQQGVVVSVDGGSPPTITVTFDGGITNTPQVAYLDSYTPAVGDVVEARVRAGDALVFGKRATS